MTSVPTSTKDAGQRLWDQVSNRARGPEERASLAEEAFARVERALVRWIGADGYRVLLERALENARTLSPALSNVRCDRGAVRGIAASVQETDATVAGEIIVTLLTQVLKLLSRVVGEEVAVRLVEQAWLPGAPTDHNIDGDKDGSRDD